MCDVDDRKFHTGSENVIPSLHKIIYLLRKSNFIYAIAYFMEKCEQCIGRAWFDENEGPEKNEYTGLLLRATVVAVY